MRSRSMPSDMAGRTWIFDLDNTLYPADSGVFVQVERRMTRFVAAALGLPEAAARDVQKAYYRDYGTTLRGLMCRHGVDPDAFLDDVHAIDLSVLAPAPALDRLLGAISGRKIVLTNGSYAHARNVLAALGLGRHFDDIYDTASLGFAPKHDPVVFDGFVRRAAIDPTQAVMIDDLVRNLAPAHRAGMTTVWIRGAHDFAAPGSDDPACAAWVDHQAPDLASFLAWAMAPAD